MEVRIEVYSHWHSFVSPRVAEVWDAESLDEAIRLADALNAAERKELYGLLKFAVKCRAKLDRDIVGPIILIAKRR